MTAAVLSRVLFVCVASFALASADSGTDADDPLPNYLTREDFEAAKHINDSYLVEQYHFRLGKEVPVGGPISPPEELRQKERISPVSYRATSSFQKRSSTIDLNLSLIHI